MVTYLPRSAWGARATKGSTGLVASPVEGAALHWPGMAKPIDAAGDIGQRRIASALRGWQNYHMDGRGWSDIAYQIAVDQAGRAWTLRGLNIRSGANGDADVNRRFGAILLVLAPGEKPSAAMIATTKAVITDFRRWFPKATAVKGHRDVRPRNSQGEQTTDCPGPIAEVAINRGDFTPGATTPTDPTTPTPAKEWDEMATEAQVESAVYKGNARYGKDFWTAPTGTGTALIKAVAAGNAAISELARFVKADDVADDAAFAAAMAEIKAANSGLKAAVDELAAAVEHPKA